MSIKIKISKKPIDYDKAIRYLEKKVKSLHSQKTEELLWILSHPSIYTAGISTKSNEILDKKINVIKTNRGGKITWHGPGQTIFYFVINLSKRKKDIRKFVNIIEKIIIDTLKEYNIKSFADRKNVGIWVRRNENIEKVAAIGIKVRKWIAYHGFAININNDLEKYKKIIPCGITDKGITNLKNIINQDYSSLDDQLIENFVSNLKI